MNFFNQFWAERKVYEPAGMFTQEHLILFVLSILILCALLSFYKKTNKQQIMVITKVLAVAITVMEGIKIFFNFYYGYTWINAWFPISFCSIFIYALWLSGFGKGGFKEIGEAFIAGAAIVGGGAYLLFPSTSLMLYPKWHYLSMYSMLFHTLMVYMGILYIGKLKINLNRKGYYKFAVIYLVFAVISIGLNVALGSNLMLLANPANIPVGFLHTLHDAAPWAYTSLVFIAYLIGPYFITAYFNETVKRVRHSKDEKVINALGN